MQKLKYSVFEKYCKSNPTKAENSFLFYICKRQNDQGQVVGIHHSVADTLCFESQTFYNVLQSLSQKQIITYTRNVEGDYDITITGNDFSDGDYSRGYISLRKAIFSAASFHELKARAQLMLMDLMYRCQCNGGKWQIGYEKFYDRYIEFLGAKRRAIREYLGAIRKLFKTYIYDKVYYFIPDAILTKAPARAKSDEQIVNESIVQKEARKLKIRKASPKDISETAQLVHQYAEYAQVAGKDIWDIITGSIRSSLDYINALKHPRERREYKLKYKLVHRIVRSSLNLQ